jgi:hypothetical protein
MIKINFSIKSMINVRLSFTSKKIEIIFHAVRNASNLTYFAGAVTNIIFCIPFYRLFDKDKAKQSLSRN